MTQTQQWLIERYELIRKLGEGGFGETWLARDSMDDSMVAIKRLQMHRVNDWKAVELFEREAKILKHLSHPSIPKYLDWFEIQDEEDGTSFCLVQELARGQTLSELVNDGWCPTEEEAFDLAQKLLDVLIYLHERMPPVIHRDVKPQNVILGDDGNIFLVDFGSVRAAHDDGVGGSTVVGTFGYMAPEQFRGRAVIQTDQYGLAATLLYVMTHMGAQRFPNRKVQDSDKRNHAACFQSGCTPGLMWFLRLRTRIDFPQHDRLLKRSTIGSLDNVPFLPLQNPSHLQRILPSLKKRIVPMTREKLR